MSECQDRQIGTTRMTGVWPRRPLPNEKLGPAKIIVVVQSEGAQEGALIFYQNERFNRYSWKTKGSDAKSPDQRGTTMRGKLRSPPSGTSRTYGKANEASTKWTKENALGETMAYQKDSRGGASAASLRTFLFTKSVISKFLTKAEGHRSVRNQATNQTTQSH